MMNHLRKWAVGCVATAAALGLASGAEKGKASRASVEEPPHHALTRKTDRPDFLRQHDMTFDQLPCGWQETPHFGNAMVGPMLYQADDTILHKEEQLCTGLQPHR